LPASALAPIGASTSLRGLPDKSFLTCRDKRYWPLL
jgi:hypothetical protein